MQFDINRTKAIPKAVSICSCCKSKIIAKCGRIKIWHWSHEATDHCDMWWEPMSEWHLSWQSHVPESMTEVIIGEHIADIKLSTGKVIEIQHSSISPEEVQEREEFYGEMTWIFDGRDFEERLYFKEKESKHGNIYYTFTFKHPRKYIVLCTKLPLYIDFSNFTFKVMEFKTYENYSDEWNTEYTSYVAWGYKLQRNFLLYRELFGKDYVAKAPSSNIVQNTAGKQLA